MITATHHVQIAAPRGCEADARAFYAGVLGMTEVPKPPALAGRGGAWFRAGTAELHVGVDEPFRPAAKAHPAFVVDSLETVVETLRTAGVEATPDDALPGYRRVHVNDPFGNRIELLEPLRP